MVRNVYLGADLIPLAAAPDRADVRAERGRALPDRRCATTSPRAPRRSPPRSAAHKPDLVALQEAAIWRDAARRTARRRRPTTSSTTRPRSCSRSWRRSACGTGSSAAATGSTSRRPTAPSQDVRLTQRDVIIARRGSKVKLGRTFAGGFTRALRPADRQSASAQQLRGWVGVDGTLAKRKFRFVDDAPRGLQPGHRRASRWSRCSRPAARSRRRSASRSSSATSTPPRRGNANDRGTSRDASAYYAAIDAGFRNPLPKRRDVLLRRGPARHDATRLETWIDHIVVRPRIRALRSGIVGDRARSAGSSRPTTPASPRRCA